MLIQLASDVNLQTRLLQVFSCTWWRKRKRNLQVHIPERFDWEKSCPKIAKFVEVALYVEKSFMETEFEFTTFQWCSHSWNNFGMMSHQRHISLWSWAKKDVIVIHKTGREPTCTPRNLQWFVGLTLFRRQFQKRKHIKKNMNISITEILLQKSWTTSAGYVCRHVEPYSICFSQAPNICPHKKVQCRSDSWLADSNVWTSFKWICQQYYHHYLVAGVYCVSPEMNFKKCTKI